MARLRSSSLPPIDRAVLRAALLIAGLALIGTAVGVGLAGCGLGTALRLGLPGIVLAAVMLVERWRYRPPAAPKAGPGWTVTGERFIDLETGRIVEVWWRPETGERRYRAGSSDRLAPGAASAYPPAPGPRSSAG